MKVLQEKDALPRVVERLGELLRTKVTRAEKAGIVAVGQWTFALKWINSPSLASVMGGITHLQDVIGAHIPLLATSYMSKAGQERCLNAGVHWLDLSGNADIQLEGVVLHIEGRPNAFKHPGRPANVFAPKSARISRWLLIHQEQFFSQREIALATAMDEGFTSRIVTRLEEMRLVQRDKHGRIRVRDANLLLDAWAEEYDFSRHNVVKGHVAARSGEALLEQVTSVLKKLGVDYAATGLAAAWVLSPFAGFRIASFYVPEVTPDLRSQLGFRQDERGANLWLVTPNDVGVFAGHKLCHGIACVHPVQVWLDLKAHPERAKEAAEHLRSELIGPRPAHVR